MSNRRYIPAGYAKEAGSEKVDKDEKARFAEETVTQPWLQHIHGFMTIGSPIDKHLLLWDHLWRAPSDIPAGDGRDFIDLTKSAASLRKCQIRWRNYYDFGDPIGFKLETARRWLDAKGDKVFEFCGCKDCGHDIGFARYLLPGKAHNDYWEDPEVFEHFIRSAMTPRRGCCPPKPRSRWLVKRLSPSLPYILSAVLLLIGTFILYKAVTEFINPDIDPLQRYVQFMVEGFVPEEDTGSRLRLLRNSVCLAGLIAGVTLAARLPLLALGMRRRAVLAFLAGTFCYLLIDDASRGAIGVAFTDLLGTWKTPDLKWVRLGVEWRVHRFGAETLGVLLAALVVVGIGLHVRKRPRQRGLAGASERSERLIFKGARPLILCGALAIALIVGLQMWDSHTKRHLRPESPAAAIQMENLTAAERDQERTRKMELQKLSARMLVPRPVWPVLLSGAGFLYLWWLATLVFDLAFVWNRYVRGGAALRRLRMWSELGGEGAAEKAGEGQRAPTSRHADGEEKCRNTCGETESKPKPDEPS
jgi:hypothetical protein